MIEQVPTAANGPGGQTATVIDMVLRDHRLLRDDIEILKAGGVAGLEMRRVLLRFMRTLRAHTVAEEGALFSVLENFRPLRVRILETMDEHDLADTLQEQLDELLRHTPDWSDTLQAKTKVLAETVEHHLVEEERLIEIGRGLLTQAELDELRGPYARLRRSTLEKDHYQPFPERGAWTQTMKEIQHGQQNG